MFLGVTSWESKSAGGQVVGFYLFMGVAQSALESCGLHPEEVTLAGEWSGSVTHDRAAIPCFPEVSIPL